MKAEQKQQAKNVSSRGSSTSGGRKSSSTNMRAESSVPSTIFEAAPEAMISAESVHHQIVDYSALATGTGDDESIPMEEA